VHVEPFSREELLARLRETRLMGFDGARVYERATLQVEAFDPDDLTPAQRYVLMPGVRRILELEDQVLALRARVAELSAELDGARARAGRGNRVFSVSPSGDVYAARLGERPRHDRSTALVVWRPRHGG